MTRETAQRIVEEFNTTYFNGRVKTVAVLRAEAFLKQTGESPKKEPFQTSTSRIEEAHSQTWYPRALYPHHMIALKALEDGPKTTQEWEKVLPKDCPESIYKLGGTLLYRGLVERNHTMRKVIWSLTPGATW